MENPSACPICGTQLRPESIQLTAGDYQFFDCFRCGKYNLSRSALKALPTKLNSVEKAALLSYLIRKMQGGKDIPRIDTYLLDELLKRQFPSLSDQINNLIVWVGDNSDSGEKIPIHIDILQTIIGSKTRDGASFVIAYLREEKLLDGTPPTVEMEVVLTMNGWKRYDEINHGAIMSRKAFMAMQYGDQDLDLIVTTHFKPAVKATGFDLYRLDEEPRAGLIDDRLRVEIRTSRFLISDLTHKNAGAYWEAGFAEGLGKPVIYTCEKSKFETQKTHFDTNHHLTIIWDKENLEEAAKQLKATIRATLPDEAILTDSE